MPISVSPGSLLTHFTEQKTPQNSIIFSSSQSLSSLWAGKDGRKNQGGKSKFSREQAYVTSWWHQVMMSFLKATDSVSLVPLSVYTLGYNLGAGSSTSVAMPEGWASDRGLGGTDRPAEARGQVRCTITQKQKISVQCYMYTFSGHRSNYPCSQLPSWYLPSMLYYFFKGFLYLPKGI